MPWDDECNTRSLSAHGLKAAQGHAQRGIHDVHSVGLRSEMPGGITSMTPLNADPHARGFKMPVAVTPGRMAEFRPPGLLRANGPLNPSPHVYGGDPKAPNTYGGVPVERKR